MNEPRREEIPGYQSRKWTEGLANADWTHIDEEQENLHGQKVAEDERRTYKRDEL